jgi:hypothetical protein
VNIKVNDVYKFRYNAEWTKKLHEPYWCFDGQLIVKKHRNGELYLVDTYWGTSENKSFTLEEALQQGDLTYICNLDEIEKCEQYDLDYYADEDLFDLSHQHRCYKAFYKRKGATKSPEKMKRVLETKIHSTEHDIAWKTDELKRLKEKLHKLDLGDIDIYI